MLALIRFIVRNVHAVDVTQTGPARTAFLNMVQSERDFECSKIFIFYRNLFKYRPKSLFLFLPTVTVSTKKYYYVERSLNILVGAFPINVEQGILFFNSPLRGYKMICKIYALIVF